MRQATQGGAGKEDRDRVDAFLALLVKLGAKSGAAGYAEEWTDYLEATADSELEEQDCGLAAHITVFLTHQFFSLNLLMLPHLNT